MKPVPKHSRRSPNIRLGIAATEAAVTLPVLVLFVYSMLQICHSIYLRQRVTAACYVGIQQLAQTDATEEAVVSNVHDLLSSRGITGHLVTLSPSGSLGVVHTPQIYTLRIETPVLPNIPAPRILPMTGTVVVEQALYK